MRRLIERFPVLGFVALSYGLSWVFWIPAVLAYRAPDQPVVTLTLLLLALVGSYGPTIAAFVATGLTEGRPGVVALLRRYLQWSGVGWALAALLIPAGVFLIAQVLGGLLGGPLGPLRWEQLTVAAFVGRLLFALPFGPLAEEAGWRGYLLPVLQRRSSALASSVVIGAIWTFWHFPMFWVAGAALPPAATPGPGTIAVYLAGVCATSIIATFLYNSTGGSLLIAVLYHLGTNLWHQVLAPLFGADPLAAWQQQRWLALAANWGVALAIVVLFGPARLSRREPVT